MATIGELNDFDVADLFDLLARRARTGRLTIKVAGQEVFLHFDAGTLRHVTSTDVTLRLGRMLVRQGIIDTPHLLEALHLQAEGASRRPLGSLLLEGGFVTQADLDRCLEDQAIEILSRAMTGENGMFAFEADIPSPAALGLLSQDAATLVREARGRAEALVTLRAQLPAASTPLVLAPGATADPALPDRLAIPEAMVHEVLRGGPRSFGELATQLALDELSLGVAVMTLLADGTVMISTRPTARPPLSSDRYIPAPPPS